MTGGCVGSMSSPGGGGMEAACDRRGWGRVSACIADVGWMGWLPVEVNDELMDSTKQPMEGSRLLSCWNDQAALSIAAIPSRLILLKLLTRGVTINKSL